MSAPAATVLNDIPAAQARGGTGLRRWHRRVGIAACIGVLCSSLSGISHPIMSRLQPPPAAHMPPPLAAPAVDDLPIGRALKNLGVEAVTHLRLVSWPAGRFYQIKPAGSEEFWYIDSRSGRRLEDGDRQYAVFLARHFAGEGAAAVRAATRVAEFGGEYHAVNRLLPVYRVEFERADGLRAYIDTEASRLATLIDDRKAVLNGLFRALHTWEFLGFSEALRVTVLLIWVGLAALVAGTGVVVYGFAWRRRARGAEAGLARAGLLRYHRAVGLTVAVTTLTFALSGGYHLVKMSAKRVYQPVRVVDTFTATELRITPAAALAALAPPFALAELSLARLPDGVYYRAAATPPRAPAAAAEHHANNAKPNPAPRVEYLHAQTGARAVDGARQHALRLAERHSGLPSARVGALDVVTRFEGEYGFVNKRLPVTRVRYDTDLADRYYVETATGALGAHINDDDTLEGWTFAYLHKWNFLDPLGKGVRDSVMALFAFGTALVALLGLTFFLRHRVAAFKRIPRPTKSAIALSLIVHAIGFYLIGTPHGQLVLASQTSEMQVTLMAAASPAAAPAPKPMPRPVDHDSSAQVDPDRAPQAPPESKQAADPSDPGQSVSVPDLAQILGGGNLMPRYPYLARLRGYEGRVLLSAYVTPEGRCDHVVVKESSGHRVLDTAAVEAVRTWRFASNKSGSLPAAAWVDIPVAFQLTRREARQ